MRRQGPAVFKSYASCRAMLDSSPVCGFQEARMATLAQITEERELTGRPAPQLQLLPFLGGLSIASPHADTFKASR